MDPFIENMFADLDDTTEGTDEEVVKALPGCTACFYWRGGRCVNIEHDPKGADSGISFSGERLWCKVDCVDFREGEHDE